MENEGPTASRLGSFLGRKSCDQARLGSSGLATFEEMPIKAPIKYHTLGKELPIAALLIDEVMHIVS